LTRFAVKVCFLTITLSVHKI